MERPPTITDPDDGDDEELKRRTEKLTTEDRKRAAIVARETIKQISAISVTRADLNGIVSAATRNTVSLQSINKLAKEPQRLWQMQALAINSDVLKGLTQSQEQMRLLTANLTKNIDFGAGKAARDIAKSFTTQQNALWKNLDLRQFKRAFYPLNLRDIDDLYLEEVQAVVYLDGIALYGVPRTSIARSILRADTAAKKRTILGNKRREIAADCRAVVEGVTSERFLPYARMLALSLDSLDADQFAASQALTSNVLDTLIFERWGEKKQEVWSKFLPDRSGRRADGMEMIFHDSLATAPIKQAFQSFDRADKQTIPRNTYNRHATVHTVSGWQYSRRNATQAAMAATSLLLFLEKREQTL